MEDFLAQSRDMYSMIGRALNDHASQHVKVRYMRKCRITSSKHKEKGSCATAKARFAPGSAAKPSSGLAIPLMSRRSLKSDPNES